MTLAFSFLDIYIISPAIMDLPCHPAWIDGWHSISAGEKKRETWPDIDIVPVIDKQTSIQD
jgi:hypothetical protein